MAPTYPKHVEEQQRRMRAASRDTRVGTRSPTKVEKPAARKSSRARPAKSSQDSAPKPAQTPAPRSQSTNKVPRFPKTKITDTHILFWGGPCSNWHTGTSHNRSSTYPGRRALELLIPRLDKLGIPHPSPKALSTNIIKRHNFSCGEQFMMACKGWLFERDRTQESLTEAFSDEKMDALCTQLGFHSPQSLTNNNPTLATNGRAPASQNGTATANTSNSSLAPFRATNQTLLGVLATTNSKSQKALGRSCANFEDSVWTPASTHVVVAACIARAEVDAELTALYNFAGRPTGSATATENNGAAAAAAAATTTTTTTKCRTFVEGSPLDRVWGVGIKWDQPACDNEKQWRGQNRLGKCHDEAAKYIRENGGCNSDEYWDGF